MNHDKTIPAPLASRQYDEQASSKSPPRLPVLAVLVCCGLLLIFVMVLR